MDYMKFDCQELAIQSEELFSICRKLDSSYDELKNLNINLEPCLKDNDDIINALYKIIAETGDIKADLYNYGNMLGKVSDVYYTAENHAKDISANLPVQMIFIEGASGLKQTAFVAGNKKSFENISEIRNQNLITETWLTELLYKNKSV